MAKKTLSKAKGKAGAGTGGTKGKAKPGKAKAPASTPTPAAPAQPPAQLTPDGPAPLGAGPGGSNSPASGYTAQPFTPVVPDYVASMFAQFGLEGLAQWYVAQRIEGKTEAQLAAEVYDQPEYQRIFPAMKALRARGRAITENEYRAVQRSYEEVLSTYGMRGSVYDNGETFRKLIESEVSARELEERVSDAKMVIDSADPNVKNALMEYYGITSADLMTFALDPKGVGKEHVDKLARSATLSGMAKSMSIQFGRSYTESLAMDSVFDNATEADFREAVSGIADLNSVQSRLAGIDQQAYSAEDAADVVVRKNATKTLASRQRAQREAARFSGTSGISSGTLGRTGI